MKDIPLILIHGFPFDHTMWFSTIASLGSKAKVLAPDLPGFGKTPLLSDETPSMEAYAQFLVRHLDENKQEKAAVAGMSMGGYVALAFAEKFPDRLCGLGLISSQAAADSEEARQARKEMIKNIKAKGTSAVTETIIPKMFSDAALTNAELTRYPQQGAENAGRDGLIWAVQAMAARRDRIHVLAEAKCPVLIVHGTEDKVVPIAKVRTMAEVCQKPIVVEIAGAGHATPLEAPDQVANGLGLLVKSCKEFAGLE
jgi:pimeloyl-ACP methyl ester carboxylesterase